jgi:hypothetical protein
MAVSGAEMRAPSAASLTRFFQKSQARTRRGLADGVGRRSGIAPADPTERLLFAARIDRKVLNWAWGGLIGLGAD